MRLNSAIPRVDGVRSGKFALAADRGQLLPPSPSSASPSLQQPFRETRWLSVSASHVVAKNNEVEQLVNQGWKIASIFPLHVP